VDAVVTNQRNPMTSPKPRRTQSRPLAPEGRAQTVQTSLSPPQAAWVASRGVPVAAYLRGLVEREMWHAAEEATRNEGVPVGPLAVVA
jgi:hypothetical protein